jgi:hypothetical protein
LSANIMSQPSSLENLRRGPVISEGLSGTAFERVDFRVVPAM